MHAPAAPRLRTVVAFAAVALCLRACALSAGPGIEAHYHPDAPKQVRAVEQFLRGDYLYVQNMHNLDGYPLFDSHLVEWLVRAGNPPLQAARRFLGLAAPGDAGAPPGPLAITWVMLLWNASLSAAAVALAVALGRRFGALAAVLAGTFAALSPLDVAAAHYTTGDTAAAFFALATVYLAVRIVETGRVLHYVLAALATAAAFSSKYHAAEAGTAVLLAHLLRHPGLEVVRSPAAWRRAAAAAVALAAGAVLTSPALLVNFSWTLRSIRDFFGWVADYGLSEADLMLSFGARLLWSAGDNGLQIVRAAGAPALAGAALALFLARPRRTAWVVASLPLAHLAIAFAMKPVGHPVHHLPAVLPLMVLAAAGCAALAGGAALALAGIL
ncbi:MAG TPA: glycosyltransferase family 39 protein, partial [bacterium]